MLKQTLKLQKQKSVKHGYKVEVVSGTNDAARGSRWCGVPSIHTAYFTSGGRIHTGPLRELGSTGFTRGEYENSTRVDNGLDTCCPKSPLLRASATVACLPESYNATSMKHCLDSQVA